MWTANMPALRPGDVVGVRLEPGPQWRGLVESAWEAGAAIFPVDHRLPPAEASELIELARPTVVVEPAGGVRLNAGVGADPNVALVIATSGTAGVPKLVELTRSAAYAAVAASALALDAGAHDEWLCCLPLGHVGGMLVLLRSVLFGAPVAIHARFDPEAVASLGGVRFLSLVPTMLGRLLDRGIDIERYRAMLVGGGPLAGDLRRRCERAGGTVFETYGLTESCGGIVYDGRPLPGVELRVADDGTIEIGGPTLMGGYRFDPGATAAAITGDGWLRTRDAGVIDDDGRLHVTGRVDDVIISGGEKIWPDEVESVLLEHPKVAEVAVGGRADPEWGSRVVAFVVPAEAISPPSLDELREFSSPRLPGFRAPRELVVLTGLPRTPMGKIRRSLLPR